MEQFKFNISLSVLNHLGRNLYRNFITVLGEAISNSWDADANNVWITIDREHNLFTIKDDGVGMTDSDFQNKFLKIGYSKRNEKGMKSTKNRPFIGRKGIGKLALLSCAGKITILSKTKNSELIGGTIDNASLDQAINEDKSSEEYLLEKFDTKSICNNLEDFQQGTLIVFNDLYDGVKNKIEYILKSATKLFSVLLASKRPLITELADKLRLKYPLLPTISPCPTMRLEAIRSIIPISCRRYPKSV